MTRRDEQQVALERGMASARMGHAVSREEAAAMVDEIDALRALYERKDFAFDEMVRLHEERSAIASGFDAKVEALIAEGGRLREALGRISSMEKPPSGYAQQVALMKEIACSALSREAA